MQEIGLGLVGLSLGIWLWLLGCRGLFWRSDPILERPGWQPNASQSRVSPIVFPTVCVIIPARNEAELLPVTLRSVLSQNYPGLFQVILIDDHSTDGTGAVAKQVAEDLGKAAQLKVITAHPLAEGWSGKLWAMQQGVQAAGTAFDYLLFTDADIQHDPANLQRLVQQATDQDLDLASVMVRLRCDSFWEQLLIPAFVFFFAKLYPFRWVNDPQKTTAAAAGGCILIRRTVLDRIGGLSSIRYALIDDCALAQAVKGSPVSTLADPNSPDRIGKEQGKIWLGLSDRTCSLRPYPSLQTIWDMVARTAFTQLNYSPALLVGTVFGMSLVYLTPVIGCLLGITIGDQLTGWLGLTSWVLMSLAYWPTIQFYRCSPVFVIGLPLIASLYTLITIDSALRYWQGRGGAWKGRIYPNQL